MVSFLKRNWFILVFYAALCVGIFELFKGIFNLGVTRDCSVAAVRQHGSTCDLTPILRILKRLEIEMSKHDISEKTIYLKGRKVDKATKVQMFSIGRSFLPEGCASIFRNLDQTINSVYISRNVLKPYVQVVAKSGQDLALSGQVLLERSPWDMHVTSIFHHVKKNCRHECTVIDAGANIGASVTLPALSLGCKVLAFELQEKLRDMIKISTKLNDFEEKELVLNGPIATETKTICYIPNEKHFAGLKTADQENHHRSSRDGHLSFAEKNCEKTRRLDSVIDENVIFKKILFMKLDVDGPELDVLHSLGEYLTGKKVDNFVIEMNIQIDKDILDLLNSLAYRCMQLCSHIGYNSEEYQTFMNGFRSDSNEKNIIPPCQLSGDVWCW